MMRGIALFVCLLLLGSFAATSGRAAEAVFPAASKFGMVVPDGFVASPSGHGFEDVKNRSAVLIVEMQPQSYAEIEKSMNAETLKKQNFAVAFRENVTLKDGKGVLIAGRQVIDGIPLRKWLMVSTAPDATALVTALVPESVKDAHPDASMRAMLTSLVYRASIPTEEFLSVLPFKLEDLAGMRPIRVDGTTVFLTEGAKDTTDATEQPLLIISAAPGGPSEQPQRDNFARNLFSGVPGFDDMRIVSTDIIRLQGVQTHQLMAEARDAKTKNDMRFVQWLRFGNGAYIRIVGIARADVWLDSFTRFRAVRDGLGPKQ